LAKLRIIRPPVSPTCVVNFKPGPQTVTLTELRESLQHCPIGDNDLGGLKSPRRRLTMRRRGQLADRLLGAS